MNLNEEIRHVLAGLAIPESVNRTIAEAMEQVERNQVAPGLAIGNPAPDFTLSNPYKQPIALHDKLAQGPVVLSFFRGDWCPVCNLQLQALQRALPEIRQAGASLVTVTPQSLTYTLSFQEKAALEFDVLSDVDQSVMRAYRVQFAMPEKVKDIYLGVFALDLGEQNTDGSWNLPVPGTFIIDRQGIIRKRHVTADFTRRMEPDDVLEALESLRTTPVSEAATG
jgi:peroxiredoxin